jgi:uncharacterized repeat protein (TIGR01451 family)
MTMKNHKNHSIRLIIVHDNFSYSPTLFNNSEKGLTASVKELVYIWGRLKNLNIPFAHFKLTDMKRNAAFLFVLLTTFVSISFGQIISAGSYHSIAICNDGTVMLWGDNPYGQLGDSTLTQRNTPVKAHLLNRVRAVSGGSVHSLALKTDGTIWSWGSNAVGQLGNGTTIDRRAPIQVTALSGMVQVAGGYLHSLAVKSDGTVWAWGDNFQGELGDGTSVQRNSPVQTSNLSGIVSVSAGNNSSFALKNDGTVWAWGKNTYGGLGDGSTTNRFLPVQTNFLTGITSISAGQIHGLALQSNGTVWAWGRNVEGELGDGTTINRLSPVQLTSLSGITAIAGGEYHSIALKSDGTVWAWGRNGEGELGNGTTTSSLVPVQVSILRNIVAIATNELSCLALKDDGTVWAWGDNTYGQIGNGTTVNSLVPVQVHNLCYVNSSFIDHRMNGYLYNDSINDCNRQLQERTLPFLPLVASPGNLYTFSNDTGYYSLGLNDSINYTIQPIIPQMLSDIIYNPCPASYPVYLSAVAASDTGNFDFGLQGASCWELKVDIVSSNKRPCMAHETTVYYRNAGFLPVDSVTLHVKFDTYNIPISASMPYTVEPDGSLLFDIGILNPLQSGAIHITDSISCDVSLTGLTQCTKAWILPANQCLIDSTTGGAWDHSSTKVQATCVNDTCRFVIYNSGSGNMTSLRQYRVYADNILVYTSNYQLIAGDSLILTWLSGGATIRLEADQHPDHPGYSHPRATIEGCGTDGSGGISTGQVNQVPMDDEDVDVEIDCRAIQNSFDPNYKANSPEGVAWAHYVLPNTPIDYTVRFQNTGTDTAYKVVVIDSLSNNLDLATLELGASSHPYSVSLSGQGVAVLKFTFSNINLSDSTTNELNSHGFVKYKITPKASTPLGTRINNAADIYFDYNFPVRTNTAFVTLGNELVLSVAGSSGQRSPSIITYPNPTKGFITVESAKNNPILQINIYSVDGRLLKSIRNQESEIINIDMQELSAGIYFLDCHTESGSEKVKVVKY